MTIFIRIFDLCVLQHLKIGPLVSHHTMLCHIICTVCTCCTLQRNLMLNAETVSSFFILRVFFHPILHLRVWIPRVMMMSINPAINRLVTVGEEKQENLDLFSSPLSLKDCYCQCLYQVSLAQSWATPTRIREITIFHMYEVWNNVIILRFLTLQLSMSTVK